MRHDLITEARYAASAAIDTLSTTDMLRVINAADQEVAGAVHREIPNIARAVDEIAARIEQGGRLFYIGAGTSGRLGVLDASECPPTFNTPPELVQAFIAGGDGALRHSVERAEDDSEQGKRDLQAHGFGGQDALVGIAASGRTPYVLGAMDLSHAVGALCIGLSCTPNSDVAQLADIAITPVPGPEVITGSTRMRAGTATKLVLNMLSTGVMVRLGYAYGNLMVNVQPTNEKLTDRARRIVSDIAGIPYDRAAQLLDAAGSVRVAIVMSKYGVSRDQAKLRLQSAHGNLRTALSENGTE
ncbi:MAG TPA: N-acetylmuramic acid 6-phosphate etherase [Bryobacteraceae bacterium]|nr:N-acetylmuramic acid 6-phosphate etherase [Bryobacteraceae bacterium]